MSRPKDYSINCTFNHSPDEILGMLFLASINKKTRHTNMTNKRAKPSTATTCKTNSETNLRKLPSRKRENISHLSREVRKIKYIIIYQQKSLLNIYIYIIIYKWHCISYVTVSKHKPYHYSKWIYTSTSKGCQMVPKACQFNITWGLIGNALKVLV